MEAKLEGIGSRILYLIDWNHARKRLQLLVDKTNAIAVMAEANSVSVPLSERMGLETLQTEPE